MKLAKISSEPEVTFDQATPASDLMSVLLLRLPSSSTRSSRRTSNSCFHSASERKDTSASIVFFVWYAISVTTAVQAICHYMISLVTVQSHLSRDSPRIPLVGTTLSMKRMSQLKGTTAKSRRKDCTVKNSIEDRRFSGSSGLTIDVERLALRKVE